MISIPSFDNRHFDFETANTALVIVDMQHDFVSKNGAAGAGMNVDPLLAIVPRLQKVLGAFRSAGMAVVHTRYGFKPDLSDLPESVRLQSRDAGGEYGTPGPMGRILTEGEEGFQIIPELTPQAGELIINKPTFGAFTYSDLDKQLRNRGITHLVIGGVTTQCCVEGTLREAVDRGYYCLTLQDGCAAFENHHHEGTMSVIQSEGHLFGWIAHCDDVFGSISKIAA